MRLARRAGMPLSCARTTLVKSLGCCQQARMRTRCRWIRCSHIMIRFKWLIRGFTAPPHLAVLQLSLEKAFARCDAAGKGWLHAHEVAALLKLALPASSAPERYNMVLQSYDPTNGGVTWAGGNVTLEVSCR